MDSSPKKTISAGGVVVGPDGRVVVVSQNGNSWSLPKGHIDAGENALQAAQREIQEETGITELELVGELGEYQRYRIATGGQGQDLSEMKTIVLFHFKTGQAELKPIDPANPEARWVAKDDVAKLLTAPEDGAFFEKIKDQL